MIDLLEIAGEFDQDAQGLWILGTGASRTNPGRQTLYFANTESSVWSAVSPRAESESNTIASMSIAGAKLTLTFNNNWMSIGLRKI